MPKSSSSRSRNWTVKPGFVQTVIPQTIEGPLSATLNV